MAQPKLGQKLFDEFEEKKKEVVREPITLDQAAETLVALLPPDTLMFVKEASAALALPMWQMLLGYAMRCADRMELYSPSILSSWAMGQAASRDRSCTNCGQLFGSPHPDAMYCCHNCFFGKVSTLGHVDNCPTKKVS